MNKTKLQDKALREILVNLIAESDKTMGCCEPNQAINAILKWHNSKQLTEGEIEKILNDVGGVEYLENSDSKFDKKHGEVTRNNNKCLAHSIKEAMDKKNG